MSQIIADNAGVVGIYILIGIFFLLLVYVVLIWANVTAKFKNALYLKELLDTKGWADLLKIIRSDEYIQAVLNACEIVLEE